MIFVTTGNSQPFPRLLERLDDISPQVNHEIIAQTGQYTQHLNHLNDFAYRPSLKPYFQQAELIISHGGFSSLEILQSSKPLLVIPRQYNYEEHFNDHQVDFSELLHQRFGVKIILDIEELTADLLNTYRTVCSWENGPLETFRSKITPILRGK
jgi:UDP-N-acetylglucosamine transferase subunit ALG13